MDEAPAQEKQEAPAETSIVARLAAIEEERQALINNYVLEFQQWLDERNLRIDPILEYRNGQIQQLGVQLRWR